MHWVTQATRSVAIALARNTVTGAAARAASKPGAPTAYVFAWLYQHAALSGAAPNKALRIALAGARAGRNSLCACFRRRWPPTCAHTHEAFYPWAPAEMICVASHLPPPFPPPSQLAAALLGTGTRASKVARARARSRQPWHPNVVQRRHRTALASRCVSAHAPFLV